MIAGYLVGAGLVLEIAGFLGAVLTPSRWLRWHRVCYRSVEVGFATAMLGIAWLIVARLT